MVFFILLIWPMSTIHIFTLLRKLSTTPTLFSRWRSWNSYFILCWWNTIKGKLEKTVRRFRRRSQWNWLRRVVYVLLVIIFILISRILFVLVHLWAKENNTIINFVNIVTLTILIKSFLFHAKIIYQKYKFIKYLFLWFRCIKGQIIILNFAYFLFQN